MALGKGLESLIPKKSKPKGVMTSSQIDNSNVNAQVLEIDPQNIQVNPHQPRQIFHPHDLEDLVNSIKVHGIIQPLIVSQKEEGRFELIAGERRLRASKVLGLKSVPVIVRSAKEQEKLELALIENLQRKNLNSLEEAHSYQRLMEEFDLTQEEVAKRVGKSRSAVANSLRLLDLPEEVKEAIVNEKITEGHARAIAALPNISDQLLLLKKIINDKLTVRDVEKAVRKTRGFKSKKFDPEIMEIEEKLRSSLGTKVEIKKRGSQGEIKIHFSSIDNLKDLINKLLSQ